jgi:hypothetical protein
MRLVQQQTEIDPQGPGGRKLPAPLMWCDPAAGRSRGVASSGQETLPALWDWDLERLAFWGVCQLIYLGAHKSLKTLEWRSQLMRQRAERAKLIGQLCHAHLIQ